MVVPRADVGSDVTQPVPAPKSPQAHTDKDTSVEHFYLSTLKSSFSRCGPRKNSLFRFRPGQALRGCETRSSTKEWIELPLAKRAVPAVLRAHTTPSRYSTMWYRHSLPGASVHCTYYGRLSDQPPSGPREPKPAYKPSLDI